MKKLIVLVVLLLLLGTVAAIAVVTKYETGNKDAGSVVGYGTANSGNTIVRLKTTADGSLCIQ